MNTDVVMNTDLSRYTMEEAIGREGDGTVFRAYDKLLQRYVAIKLILNQNKNAIVDARTMARCHSPYVIQVFDVFHDEQQMGIVMELITGGNRSTSGSIADMSTDIFYKFYHQVIEAIKSIHQNNLLHLDLKPSNILIDSQGNVKVANFGVAKLTCKESVNEIVKSDQRRSWHYLAPEQIQGESVSEATDIFTLGIILYTYLFKVHPFLVHGDTKKSQDNIIDAKLQSSSVQISDSEAPLVELVTKMLSRNKAERPSLASVYWITSHFFNDYHHSDNHLYAHNVRMKNSPVLTFDRFKLIVIFIISCVLIGVGGYLWIINPQPIRTTLVVSPLKIKNENNLACFSVCR